MDGDGPSQSDGVLDEHAQFLFLNFLLLFVVSVADVRPSFFLYVEFLSVFGDDVDGIVLIDARHRADGAVHPSLVGVVLDEDDLCSRLQFQFHQCREAVFRKLTLDFTFQYSRFTRKLRQFLFVDEVHRVASGGEGDVHIALAFLDFGAVAGIQQLQVDGSGGVRSDMVEHAHECFICLSIYFSQLDGHQLDFVEDSCREEVWSGVEAVEDFPFVTLHHRLQLIHITHQQNLLASERFTHIL